MVIGDRGDQLIGQLGFQGIFSWFGKSLRHICFFVLNEVMHKVVFCFWRLLLHHSPIGLLDVFGAKELIHAGQRFAGFGKDHNARNRPVEAVTYAHKHIARLVVAAPDIFFYLFRQGCITRFITLHDLGRLLVDHDQVVVLEEDLFRQDGIALDVEQRSKKLK